MGPINFRRSKTTPAIERRAALAAPNGFVLWATYPSFENADLAQGLYGRRDDLILPVSRSRRWALYGRALGTNVSLINGLAKLGRAHA